MLVDSDVLIDYLRGREPAKARLVQLFALSELLTTVVNQFELLAGSRHSSQEKAVRELLSMAVIVPLDSEAAWQAGKIKLELSATGMEIGMADCLIAGIAVSRDIPLLTRNRRHFERIPRLKLSEF